MDIVNNWLSANDTLLPYATGNRDIGITGNVNFDIARAVRDIISKGETFPTVWEGNENCISLTDVGKTVTQCLKEYSQ
jgi:hypothetical protein